MPPITAAHLTMLAADPSTDIFGKILQFGVLGVVLLLILLGWLVPKAMYEQMKTERDTWRDAYQRERDGHQATRDAYIEQSRANVAAFETARTTAGLLERLGHQPARPGGPG